MKPKFTIILLFIICEINLFYSGDIQTLPINYKNPKIVKSKINLEIDMSGKIGSFNEKVLYNLEFDNNELKSVTYIKNLPVINAKYFDLKVDSKDVKITKYEIVEKGNNKTLNVEFIKEQGKELKNSKEGNVKIDYKYKTKDLQLVEESKNKFILKDVEFVDDNSNSYPTKFNVEITNLPKNLKVDSAQLGEERINLSKKDNSASTKNPNLKKRVKINEKEEKIDILTFNFNSTMGGNNSPTYKKLRLEFINNEPERKSTTSKITAISVADPFSAAPSSDRSSKLNLDGSGVTTKKSYYYKSKNNDDPWESIIAILMLVCLCFLCIQCCNGSSNAPAAPKNQNNNDGHQDANGEGLNYY